MRQVKPAALPWPLSGVNLCGIIVLNIAETFLGTCLVFLIIGQETLVHMFDCRCKTL